MAHWQNINDNEKGLVGDLTFETVMPLCQQVKKEFSLNSSHVLNLAKVEHCDSASLILLLTIIELFSGSQYRVSFVNVPKAIRTLITLYNLQTIIEVSDDI